MAGAVTVLAMIVTWSWSFMAAAASVLGAWRPLSLNTAACSPLGWMGDGFWKRAALWHTREGLPGSVVTARSFKVAQVGLGNWTHLAEVLRGTTAVCMGLLDSQLAVLLVIKESPRTQQAFPRCVAQDMETQRLTCRCGQCVTPALPANSCTDEQLPQHCQLVAAATHKSHKA